MTDMRATERLLEVIEESATLAVTDGGEITFSPDELLRRSAAIKEAITELRRRGDTLVRAADLRVALEPAKWGRISEYDGDGSDDAWAKAIDRLENALGGRLR